ncbi:NADH-dependent flavin oxidoreductase [Staphylococcus agnetis]|uniref:NADH-dependent flavin oxidoreductase n=1 Tax=Staphylococcus agnetis TaxID=985762 RepID=UPI0004E46374|nr:NADH-dependent flavin oxidoreductase [Staphylococcus agnetis]KFE41886.1 NADH-dependent flavin oxidoreductase [Staphylococcus agnetis]NJH65973.1 NADH-dependent flavin oxidoreductase [Staphylococcus agnetis]NJH98315.1 NADH-dependent flavin oxidoreductase [Staphylococcus agnetis]PTH49052.1 NADH-dependent flavin oxidoreductase [Staphylococcus agnetis]PTH73595.1 NADH-dependent flavin oxidoreductase [Staphylococcus agnetis]
MEERFKPLFESVVLPNGKRIKNKFVLAPLTHTLSNDDGTASDREIAFMKSRTHDVGMAITAASYINIEGKAFPGHPSISKEADLEGLSELARTIKQNGAVAIMQIHHGGARALPEYVPNGDVKAPSQIEDYGYGKQEPHASRAMTAEEVEAAIKDYGRATALAIQAGFDGIEIHGANHYLIHQFVSPYYNHREDKWKDPFAFSKAVIEEVLEVKTALAPRDFVIGYRFSPEEAEKPGITMEHTQRLLQELITYPLDYLHASLMDIQSVTRDGKYAGATRITLLKQWINQKMPLIGIGSIYSGNDALKGLELGADFVALGRGLLLDPHLIEKIEHGKEDEIVNAFDARREDHHQLPDELWQLFNKGRYPVPKKEI